MTTLLTRMFRTRCAACQVGQGRMCQCEGAARVCNGKRQRPRPRVEMSDAAWLWVIIVMDVLALVGAFSLARWTARVFA